ncbi:IclR family transcriptional regulator [Rhodococcoides yunnanense]|uniref:IclR family transcriptional regulator n=1 Tax=Rhodococcoides yunnanense TaxID=278209 RepID=UPI000932320E|nr:IclR family transcriptional regulator [Rhodococcus yunnanensis]
MSPIHRAEGEISAIGRSTEILKAFLGSSGTLSPAALVRRTGMAKTTVYRMVEDLARVGLLERHGTDYRLGLLLFEIGESVPRQRSLREAARRHLSALREATGHNVGLAVLDGSDVVYLEVFRGEDGPRLPHHMGGRWPAYASCSGKAILAFTPPAQVAQLEFAMKAHTENTITDPELLIRELERVRKSGVAFDRQEAFLRIAGAAAPIFGPDEEVLGAISISGMAGRINLTRIDAAVRTTAISISRDLSSAHSVVRPVLQRH